MKMAKRYPCRRKKKRNYDEKTKGEVLSEETRNALLGILVFLIAVIGLVETAGPLGKIIRYIFEEERKNQKVKKDS